MCAIFFFQIELISALNKNIQNTKSEETLFQRIDKELESNPAHFFITYGP